MTRARCLLIRAFALRVIFSQEGKVFPCIVVLYFHAVLFTFYALPYFLRGLRVVILSHKGELSTIIIVETSDLLLVSHSSTPPRR